MENPSIEDQIKKLEKQIEHYKSEQERLQAQLRELRDHTNEESQLTRNTTRISQPETSNILTGSKKTYPLLHTEYKRYGRQLIMPEIGLAGQLSLKSSAVLIIGAGGLGCPAAAYLAGAGVGRIGIMDGDVVEESNLHRQILHGGNVGMNKAMSAIQQLKRYHQSHNKHLQADLTHHRLNPLPEYTAHPTRLTPTNALSILSTYTLILDCTDNPASRYLISDASIILHKPLVTASALRTEGQLMVLNHPAKPAGDPEGSPCYRCVFPRPPPADSIVSCSDGGILGPVVGVMGVLQALEALKVLTGAPVEPPSLLLFAAYSSPQFRSIKLRRRKAKCAACSGEATVDAEALMSGSMDYVQFCGALAPLDMLGEEERITPREYAGVTKVEPHILIDVREKVHFDLCHLENSYNIPFSGIMASSHSPEAAQRLEQSLTDVTQKCSPEAPVCIVCRLGNDSQIAVRKFKELKIDRDGTRFVGDIKGGLRAWREQVDQDFPEY